MLKLPPFIKASVIVLVSVLSLSALLGQFFYQQQKLLKAHESVVHTLHVRDVADKLSVDIQEGTSAARGLLLTGDKIFLADCKQFIDYAPILFNQLGELTQDDPVQQKYVQALMPLFQQRIQLMQTAIGKYKDLSEADLERLAHESQSNNQNTNALFSRIQNQEKQLLTEREAQIRQNVAETTLWSIAVVALLILLLALLAWSFNKEWQQRQNMQKELALANGELEARNANLEAANAAFLEADHLKTGFLSAMNHELRAPLNSIIGIAGILRRDIAEALDDEQTKQLDTINASAQHLLSFIDDLLDLSRIESGPAKLSEDRFELKDVVADALATVSPLAAKKNLSLIDHCKHLQTPVISDQRKVYQILLNLVNNAVKFSEHGDIEVSCHASGQFWLICVSDQGTGIKPENLPALFEGFRQLDGSAHRAYEGTGLGVYLSKKLVEMLGGSITVVSELGKGTQFCFTLPRHDSVLDTANTL